MKVHTVSVQARVHEKHYARARERIQEEGVETKQKHDGDCEGREHLSK